MTARAPAEEILQVAVEPIGEIRTTLDAVLTVAVAYSLEQPLNLRIA
jgi:hypothetical protein